MKKKVRVLFIAYNDKQWMGGIYYVKNIVYQFLEYSKTQSEFSYEAYVLLDDSVLEVFDFCNDYKNAKLIVKRKHMWNQGNGFICRNLRELGWIFRVYGRRIDYIYPSFSTKSIYRKKIISWIPDFQHVKYPEFFTKEENEARDRNFEDIAKHHSKLVLSSQDAFETYQKLYPDCCENVGVVHFVSALKEEDIYENVDELLVKYGILGKYFIVSNQFYRHKNHLVLFKAINILRESRYSDIQLVCTGMPKDVKDASYIEEVNDYINQNDLKNNIKILGLIPRKEQLALMRNAIAVIQPSLFEGWGTCTEDAKVLGKITVLSDIPVHREQADENAILFKKDDKKELSVVLAKLWENSVPKKESILRNTKAVDYGKMFVDLLVSEE